MRRSRLLSEADRALWAHYTRQIAPLPGKISIAPQRATPTDTPSSGDSPGVSNGTFPGGSAGILVDGQPQRKGRILPPAPATRANVATLAVGTQPGGIDSGTWHRFRSGKLPAVRKLDLHGMTAQRAFNALTGFIRSAHADGVRCVEIVTGRGSGEHGGVIRRELPLWLNLTEIRPMILGAVHPHAANPGAVRLILRRIR